MINMCQPTHKRYNVAVTKVLGKYMEAIIVDTEKTARHCIQVRSTCVFFPSDNNFFLCIDIERGNAGSGNISTVRLLASEASQRAFTVLIKYFINFLYKLICLSSFCRNISEPRNVKLVFDVLKFEPPEIERAVLFATNNALVCETPEDAMKVAYEIDRTRYDALALDGTFYQKSGILSGGSHDLARKAKRWDEKHMAQLKMEKDKLNEELKELVKKSRKQSELATVESQIKVKKL